MCVCILVCMCTYMIVREQLCGVDFLLLTWVLGFKLKLPVLCSFFKLVYQVPLSTELSDEPPNYKY